MAREAWQGSLGFYFSKCLVLPGTANSVLLPAPCAAELHEVMQAVDERAAQAASSAASASGGSASGAAPPKPPPQILVGASTLLRPPAPSRHLFGDLG